MLRRLFLVSLHEQKKIFVSHSYFSLEEIPKIKICHMVAKEHPEVIEGRRQLIAVDVLDSEKEDEDASINHDGAVVDEEGGIHLVGTVVTEEVEDM